MNKIHRTANRARNASSTHKKSTKKRSLSKGKKLAIGISLCALLLVGALGNNTNLDNESVVSVTSSNAEMSATTDANETDGTNEDAGFAQGSSDSGTNADASASEDSDADSAEANASDKTTTVSGTLRVRYLDVGQGDCAIISYGSHHMMIDGGKSSASSKVYSVLKTLKITKLDCIIASHPDADHIGGLSGALEYATVGKFYCSTTTHDTKTFNSIKTRLSKQSVSITVPSAGDSFKLGDATVTFVGPTTYFDDEEESNNSSLVCRIDYGTTSFLFTGDAEEESEASMLAHDANVEATVLKVGHHGSKSSTSTAFLRAVNPTYAIISVGENSYGHPTSAALSRLESAGVTVMRTDKLGSITATSNGKKITFTNGKRVTE